LTTGLAVDSSGNVFAANDHSILKFDANGTKTTFASDWISPDKQWNTNAMTMAFASVRGS